MDFIQLHYNLNRLNPYKKKTRNIFSIRNDQGWRKGLMVEDVYMINYRRDLDLKSKFTGEKIFPSNFLNRVTI